MFPPQRGVVAKYWKVEISILGGSEPLFLGTVEAASWPAALQAGRAQIGESGGVPAGASCNVNPNGMVTIQDARERRRYQIKPDKAPAPPPGTKRPVPGDPDIALPLIQAAAPVPLRRETSPPRRWSSAPPPAPPLPSTADPRRGPQPSSPPPASVESKLILLASRDEEPSASSPIHFRERMYAVPLPLETGTGEKLATQLLRRVQKELSERRGAKYVRIEIFDHVWKSSPKRAAVVRLEWKDWNPSIDIEFPQEEAVRRSEAPGISRGPSVPAEDRLEAAFEACHDLLFLKNRAEALEFADHSFDAVISTFGTMFARDPEAVATELARVVKPGGRVSLANWAVDGSVHQMFKLIRSYKPAEENPAPSPFDWGKTNRVVELLGWHFELEFETGTSFFRPESGEQAWATFSTGFGPVVTLLETLSNDQANALREEFVAFHEAHRGAAGIVVERPYVITKARRVGVNKRAS